MASSLLASSFSFVGPETPPFILDKAGKGLNTMNTTKPELKPCPFCKGSVDINDPHPERSHNFVNLIISHEEWCPMHHDRDSYAAKGRRFDKIIEAWNTRAPLWQDIDSAPKDGTYIFACGLECDGRSYPDYRWGVIWWCDGKETGSTPRWLGGHFNSHGEPTHWMPLPEPPSAE